MDSAEVETVDLLVIGAGLSGLAFASFYLEIHPETNLLIVDESPDIGGVWSNSRMFKSFWTQSSVGLSGFSRPPFKVPKGVTNNYNLYHASLMSDYLDEFVTFHKHGGRTLRDRIRLDTRVSLIEKYCDPKKIASWRVTCSSADKCTERKPNFTITASKLAVASGRASSPYIPRLPGQDDFMGCIIHHKEYGEFCRSQKDVNDVNDVDETAPRKNITVLGAGKSAADLVYDSIKNGGERVKVSWLIRKEAGEGPAIFLPAADPHYDNSLTRSMIRWRNLYSPSSFMSAWHYPLIRLIYGTSYGRAQVEERLEKVRAGCVGLGRYRDREGALPGFKLLEPDRAHYPFWCTGPLGLTQHDDFWDLVAQKVHIYRNDIQSIVKDGIILDDDQKIDSDIILCGTGWRPGYTFLAPELESDIELPGVSNPSTEQNKSVQKHDEGNQQEHRENRESNSTSSTKVKDKNSQEQWSKLLSDADSKVISQFPVLANPPEGFRKPANVTISQLFNCMAPLSNMYGEGPGEGRSIVFLGHCDTSSSFRVAEAQGIWATAFLDGNLQLPKEDSAREEVAYMNAFSRRRYPSRGNKGDNIFFEALWYTDKLMADLGLTSHRSHRSWWANWTEPVQMSDFKDMPDEFRRRFGIKAKK